MRVVNELAVPAGGFYTEEIREHGGASGSSWRRSTAKRLCLRMLISRRGSVWENMGSIFPRWRPLVLKRSAAPCVPGNLL